jgi:hypothetical protein
VLRWCPRRTGRDTARSPMAWRTGGDRGWLRGVQRGARSLISHAVTVAAGAGTNPFDGRSASSRRGNELARPLDAVALAARSFARHHPRPAPPVGPGCTGIDYLGLLAAQHRRQVEDRLRVADRDGRLSTLPPWHLANVVAAGRLLTAAPSG